VKFVETDVDGHSRIFGVQDIVGIAVGTDIGLTIVGTRVG
jgi:hypothetical protein